MAAEAASPSLPDFELRVLDGEQRGASAPVPMARSFEIGGVSAGAGCDVQLRDPLIGAARVRVMLLGAAGARVQLLAGEVRVNGRLLAEGGDAEWPLYVPLQIGGTVLAIGEPDSAQWQLPVAVAAPPIDVEAAPVPVPANDEHVAVPMEEPPVPAQPPRRIDKWLAVGGGALSVVAVALWLLAGLLGPKPAVTPDAQHQVAQLLSRTPGLEGLRVDAGATGPVIHGYLATNAQRERLVSALANAGLGAVGVDVWSGEQLAAAVSDVFRVQGVTGQAEADGAGQVTVRTQEADLPKLNRAMATARRDIPGLVGLVLQNRPPAPPPDDTPVTDDPGKRVAAIVPGDSAYVATADGTRYFVGALLPTGHRIEAIEPHRVLLAKDGQRSELGF